MKKVIFILLMFFWLPIANAADDLYDSFESYTVDSTLDMAACTGWDANYTGYADQGFSLVQNENSPNITVDTIIPRYGDKYYKLGVTVDDCETVYDDGYKVYSTFENVPEASCHLLEVGTGNEYWIGFSMYIPSDYFLERYRQGVWHIYGTAGAGYRTITMRMGGTDDAVTDGGWDYAGIYGSTSYSGELDPTWTDDRGEWVDFVIHAVLYDTNNAAARLHIYKDGTDVAIRPNGQANAPTGVDSYFEFMDYNAGFSNCDGLTAAECAAGGGGYPYVFQCSTDYVDPFVTFERATWVDEFRITSGSAGVYGYCDACPPIWSSAPAITNPTQNETDISTTETVTYGAYVDHRTDTQTCFARTSTTVQIDEQGGNWSSLVYENTSAGATSQAVSGLSENTSYQMRVMHKSLRSGTSDTYDGIWSATRDFFTGAPPEPISAGVFSPLGQGGFGTGYGRLQ